MTCTTTYFAFDIHNTHFALHIPLHTLHVYDFNLKIAKTGITLFYVRINLCSLGIQIKIMLQTALFWNVRSLKILFAPSQLVQFFSFYNRSRHSDQKPLQELHGANSFL